MPVQVKICGLKTAQALHAAINAGADFVGFVDHAASPRHIAPEDIATTLLPLVPAHVQSVIVTVNPSDDWIMHIDTHIRPSYIQLHGNESPERIREIKSRCDHCRIIKAIGVKKTDDLKMVGEYATVADMLLFDAKPSASQLPGGNGLAFEWKLLQDIALDVPWLLSGGLNVDNVAQAISQTGACMVDVSSGVESSAGVKDESLIKNFIRAAKA